MGYCRDLENHVEEEYLCAYCQECKGPYRHNTPNCYRFANALRKKQWELVEKYSLCERCLFQKPSGQIEDQCSCSANAPELCQYCPVPHQAKLQCRIQPSTDEPTNTVLITKNCEREDVSKASDNETRRSDDLLICLHCYDEHKTTDCIKLQDLNPEAQLLFIRENEVCEICLDYHIG